MKLKSLVFERIKRMDQTRKVCSMQQSMQEIGIGIGNRMMIGILEVQDLERK